MSSSLRELPQKNEQENIEETFQESEHTFPTDKSGMSGFSLANNTVYGFFNPVAPGKELTITDSKYHDYVIQDDEGEIGGLGGWGYSASAKVDDLCFVDRWYKALEQNEDLSLELKSPEKFPEDLDYFLLTKCGKFGVYSTEPQSMEAQDLKWLTHEVCQNTTKTDVMKCLGPLSNIDIVASDAPKSVTPNYFLTLLCLLVTFRAIINFGGASEKQESTLSSISKP
jgi:hypothetical protein